jgi:hypothetical protein
VASQRASSLCRRESCCCRTVAVLHFTNLKFCPSPFFDWRLGKIETEGMESSYKADYRQPLPSQRSVSSEGSRRSKASQKSVGRYRRTEGGVDESLFSASKTEDKRGSSAPPPPSTKAKKASKVEMDSTVLTTTDLDRIRRAAAPAGQNDNQDEYTRQEREAALERAKERKQRMLAMEAQRKARQEKSDLEIEDEQRSSSVVANAQHVREETLDAVKNMNSQVHAPTTCPPANPRTTSLKPSRRCSTQSASPSATPSSSRSKSSARSRPTRRRPSTGA